MRRIQCYLLLACLLFNCEKQIQNNTDKVEVKHSAKDVQSSFEYINEKGVSIKDRIQTPPDFQRTKAKPRSFESFLQNFSLKPHGSFVHYFDGTKKSNQDSYVAILNIDVGNRDLQQCADAVIRLRAEYLFSEEKFDEINFHFTNGFLAEYSKWRSGYRIKVDGNKVNWFKTNKASQSYQSFREYLNMVFSYAGTLSLSKELKAKSLSNIAIGDVLIQGGSPGHAVIVVDAAEHIESKERVFLLAQSYMPAQDIHILKNKRGNNIEPWYSTREITENIYTPDWTFQVKDLKSF